MHLFLLQNKCLWLEKLTEKNNENLPPGRYAQVRENQIRSKSRNLATRYCDGLFKRVANVLRGLFYAILHLKNTDNVAIHIVFRHFFVPTGTISLLVWKEQSNLCTMKHFEEDGVFLIFVHDFYTQKSFSFVFFQRQTIVKLPCNSALWCSGTLRRYLSQDRMNKELKTI